MKKGGVEPCSGLLSLAGAAPPMASLGPQQGQSVISDVAALHATPPDWSDDGALLDALRVTLHEQPDIHEKVTPLPHHYTLRSIGKQRQKGRHRDIHSGED